MSWTNRLVIFALLLAVSACGHAPTKQEIIPIPEAKHSSSHLIELEQLLPIMAHDSIVVVDMRKPEDYALGHIPGAINIWRPDIQDESLPYAGILASREQIADKLSELGISEQHHLVIYDDKASCDAARLWWVLDHYGFTKTSLLHGGLKKWKVKQPVSTEVTVRPAAAFRFPEKRQEQYYITLVELTPLVRETAVHIIDSRSSEEYLGATIKSGAFAAGHIPGSINIDWTSTVDYEKQTFRDPEDLLETYRSFGIDSSTQVVVYCHSGVRSAHTTFVLTQLLGFQHVRNFDGSWTEWSYHQLPILTDTLKRKSQI